MIDLAIITAIPEEYEAVLAVLRDTAEPILPPQNPIMFGWRIGYLGSSRYRSPYSVVLAMCTEQTRVPSSLATVFTVSEFRPRYVLFCGIAGGLNPPHLPSEEQLRLGDILLASAVWGYEYGKVNEDGMFLPRPDQIFRADPGLKQAAELFARLDRPWRYAARRAMRQSGIEVENLPHAITGPVASGDKVIDNPESDFFAQVVHHWPKLRGVEMEGAGAGAAIELLAARRINAGFLMVRGISDLPRAKSTEPRAETSERDSWKRAASRAAAAFVAQFVSGGWPVGPLGELEDDGSSFGGPPSGQELLGRAVFAARSTEGCEERVLFYMADRELQANSGIDWERSHDAVAERLRLELRLVFLCMTLDGEIVFPPTYFLETKACRDLIREHLWLVEAGYVKLLVNRPSLDEYLEIKQMRYSKARRFQVYFDAYFSGESFHGLAGIPFQLTDKSTSVGSATLKAWQRSLLGRIQRFPRFVSRARRFLDISAETERTAILYENILENQNAAGLTREETLQLDARTVMNRFYLLNYLRLGFTIPERSALVWTGLTRGLPRSGLDLVALGRIVSEHNLTPRLLAIDARTLVTWRMHPTIRAFFVACRDLLREGLPLDRIADSESGKQLLSDLARVCS